MVGDGGKYVEAMPDVQLLLPPFDELDVKRGAVAGCASRRCSPACAANPRLDVDAFCAAVLAVCRLMMNAEIKGVES